MAKTYKPMLAPTDPVDPDDLTYPLYATPKLDGVRCVMREGAKQRSLKPVRNTFVCQELQNEPEGLDGELTVGTNFHKSSGDIRRESGEPDFTYWVFDYYDEQHPDRTYLERIEALKSLDGLSDRIVLVLPVRVDSAEELRTLVSGWVDEGYEGGMVRTGDSPYKFGRATLKQNWIMKIKEFVDEEAEVIDTYEWMHNDNEAKTNELGRTERSSHKENLRPSGMLGGFVLRSDKWQDFRCGSMLGVTHEERKALWERRDELVGELVKFKYQPHGSVDRPRLPIFLGFRDPDDT
jgi:DNA ligase-1